MNILIIFAHPKRDSFSGRIMDEFVKGVEFSGNEVQIFDLYKDDFKTDMSFSEYLRETGMKPEVSVSEDVKEYHNLLKKCDGLVFFYPVWWSDVPAKLKGWFDRVFSYGFAYKMPNDNIDISFNIKKIGVYATAGQTREKLQASGVYDAMKVLFLNDRIKFFNAPEKDFQVFDGITAKNALGETHLEEARRIGQEFLNGSKS